MRQKINAITILLLLIAVTGSHAGNLDPSSAPASTMKTLDQVEPRTPLNATTAPGDDASVYIITQSGSYYLTGNVAGGSGKSGIVIAADNVSIDLGGFTLEGGTGSLDGIRPSGYRSNIIIRNGIVKSWGGHGITNYVYGFPNGSGTSFSLIENIISSNNGSAGIRSSFGGIVRNCIARDNGGTGIATTNHGGVIEGCSSDGNGEHGYSIYEGATISNSSSIDNTGIGIYCGNSGHTITGCTVHSNDGGGIYASGTTVKGCNISSNGSYGIKISFNSLIEGNSIDANQGDGISGVNIAGNGGTQIIGNNICRNSGYGISLTNNPGNFIYKNTLRDNSTANFNLGSGNSAPYSSSPESAGPWHNIVF